MAIWGFGSRRGDFYAVDYAVEGSPKMLSEKVKFKGATDEKSLEGHINSHLAEKHSVPVAQVQVAQIVRILE